MSELGIDGMVKHLPRTHRARLELTDLRSQVLELTRQSDQLRINAQTTHDRHKQEKLDILRRYTIKAFREFRVKYTIKHLLIKRLLGLLSVARCPNCDNSGIVVNRVMRDTSEEDGMGFPVGYLDFETEQCQWCDERAEILKAVEG